MTTFNTKVTKATLLKPVVAISLAFGLVSLNAQALDSNDISEGQQPLAAEFKKLDANANEKLSPVEASKDKLFTANHFAKADVDKDGALSQEEYANYKSADQKQKMGVLIDDSTITAKAKAELLAEKELKSLQISVETRKGQVILSGFVDNQLSKDKAEVIVGKIEGVKSVKNSLVVKS